MASLFSLFLSLFFSTPPNAFLQIQAYLSLVSTKECPRLSHHSDCYHVIPLLGAPAGAGGSNISIRSSDCATCIFPVPRRHAQERFLHKVVRTVDFATECDRERAQARNGSQHGLTHGWLKRISSVFCRSDC